MTFLTLDMRLLLFAILEFLIIGILAVGFVVNRKREKEMNEDLSDDIVYDIPKGDDDLDADFDDADLEDKGRKSIPVSALIQDDEDAGETPGVDSLVHDDPDTPFNEDVVASATPVTSPVKWKSRMDRARDGEL